VGLEEFTGGWTDPSIKADCQGETKLPGCNKYGYFYGGIPPKGADSNFNRKEDFAESFAAIFYVDIAQKWVNQYNYYPYKDYLFYPNYLVTPRGMWMRTLIDVLLGQ
ncbi:MAG: hypothetical protein WA110_01455, partial [Anaerolineaceae bacterium]